MKKRFHNFLFIVTMEKFIGKFYDYSKISENNVSILLYWFSKKWKFTCDLFLAKWMPLYD